MQKTNIKLIGYDLLAPNIEYLKNGAIDFMIAQRQEKQAYLIISDLCKKLMLNQETKNQLYIYQCFNEGKS